MSLRTQTISSLRSEAATLLALSDTLDRLSDDAFDRLFPMGTSPLISPTKTPVTTPTMYYGGGEAVTPSLDSWGAKKRIVLDIITDKGKAMRKEQIITEFEERAMATEQEDVVTNALTALRVDESIHGGKISGMKFRGKYWGLKEWFDGDILKEEFIPASAKMMRGTDSLSLAISTALNQ